VHWSSQGAGASVARISSVPSSIAPESALRPWFAPLSHRRSRAASHSSSAVSVPLKASNNNKKKTRNEMSLSG